MKVQDNMPKEPNKWRFAIWHGGLGWGVPTGAILALVLYFREHGFVLKQVVWVELMLMVAFFAFVGLVLGILYGWLFLLFSGKI
jgi:hypothetical protein